LHTPFPDNTLRTFLLDRAASSLPYAQRCAALPSTKKRDAPLRTAQAFVRRFPSIDHSRCLSADFLLRLRLVRASNARAPVALMVAFAPTLCGHSAMRSHTA
jgi:hypothetical protein